MQYANVTFCTVVQIIIINFLLTNLQINGQ